MLDIKFILKNVKAVKASVKARNVHADVDALVALYAQRNEILSEMEAVRAEGNRIAKEIPQATTEERPSLIQKGAEIKAKVTKLEEKNTTIEADFKAAMLTIPNILPEDTPKGFTDNENVLLKTEGTPTTFDFTPKDHLELGESLDLIDFEAGAKVAGAKFYFLKNEAVLLELALQQYALQKAIQKGYIPLQTPDLAREEVLSGAGFSPRGNESNTYMLEEQDLCLIGTAEIAVGGMHANEILKEASLPLKYVAISHCFRTEAGAGGQASKGLYRVHQFTKIELYHFTKPELAEQELEDIRKIEEEIYQELGIPYRLMHICAGDLGAPAYKKYDLEAWMPGKGEKGEYGEVTSVSNCTTFQARRLKVRYKNKETGKNEFVATLNGTAIAISRTVIAILENYQNADGSVTIPEILRPFMGINKINVKK